MPSEPASRFLRACSRLPVDCTPVWFMRQAGRYMKEYRAVREKYSLLDICRQPELATEVTLQPVKILGVDAAILFADLLLPLVPMGIQLEFAAGEGPVIHNPVRNEKDVEALRPVEVQNELAATLETLRLVRKELDHEAALIGFAGAPFTLASYLIEGGASRNFVRTKRMMLENPRVWKCLMNKLSETILDFVLHQVEAGAQAIQLFDSWVGTLTPDDYRQFVLPYSQLIFEGLRTTGVPAIHFGTNTAALLPGMKEAGGDVIGLDWQTPLDWGWRLPGKQVAVQGNLDPVALFAGKDELEERVECVLRQASGKAGHIFNLGHGILPETPVDQVRRVVEWVHEKTYQPAQAGVHHE